MAPKYLPGADGGGTISHSSDIPTASGWMGSILSALIPGYGGSSSGQTTNGGNGSGEDYGDATKWPLGRPYAADHVGDSKGGYTIYDQYGSVLNYIPGSGGDGGGSSGPNAAVIPFQPVMPPALDILSEMRARRESQSTMDVNRLKALLDMVSNNLPENLTYYPGYEPGGLYDHLTRLMNSGSKTKAEGLPLDQRKVQRKTIPIPEEIKQPTVAEDLGSAQQVADAIMKTIQMIQTGEIQLY